MPLRKKVKSKFGGIKMPEVYIFKNHLEVICMVLIVVGTSLMEVLRKAVRT